MESQDFNGKPVLQTGDEGFESSGHLASRETLRLGLYQEILTYTFACIQRSAWVCMT